jgi:hypothetical protein
MPNWTSNILIIEGMEDELNAFKDFVFEKKPYVDSNEDRHINFNKIIPYPKELEKRDKLRELSQDLSFLKETKRDEYIKSHNITKQMLAEILLFNLEEDNELDYCDWHTAHWGTKWNACYTRFYKVDKKLMYSFDTAWSPPLKILNAMLKKYKTLNFTLLYGEEGMNFSGFIRIEKGKVVEDIYHNHCKNWAYPKTLMKRYKLEKCNIDLLSPIGEVKL